MAGKGGVSKEERKEVWTKMILLLFRAFLASPILRELSTVKQENRNIKVRSNVTA